MSCSNLLDFRDTIVSDYEALSSKIGVTERSSYLNTLEDSLKRLHGVEELSEADTEKVREVVKSLVAEMSELAQLVNFKDNPEVIASLRKFREEDILELDANIVDQLTDEFVDRFKVKLRRAHSHLCSTKRTGRNDIGVTVSRGRVAVQAPNHSLTTKWQNTSQQSQIVSALAECYQEREYGRWVLFPGRRWLKRSSSREFEDPKLVKGKNIYVPRGKNEATKQLHTRKGLERPAKARAA